MAAVERPITTAGMVEVPTQAPRDFNEIIEQVPDEWKAPFKELIGSAASMYVQISNYDKSLQQIGELERLVTAKTPPDPSVVKSILQRASKLKDSCKNAVKSYFCADYKSSCTEADYEAIWKKAQDEVMEKLKEEKVEAAQNCVKGQLIASSIVVMVECQAIYAMMSEIDKAGNIIKQCREVDLPYIRERIDLLRPKEKQLRDLSHAYIEDGLNNATLKSHIQGLSVSLTGDLSDLREMIGQVRCEVNSQLQAIGNGQKDQIRRGVSNAAQCAGNLFQYLHLAENLTQPYKLAQAGIAIIFAALAVGNAATYVMSGTKLEELRNIQGQIREMSLFVRSAMEAVRQAETFYLPTPTPI